ncbi:MAG: hypothetical protein ACOX1Y_01935 [Zhaonellaceae bacterium]|jgi:hypothetical protein
MEKLFEQLKDYLRMDSEIPFEEFLSYYQEVLDCFIKDYQEFDEDTLIKAKFIASIVNANAVARAKRKGNNTKKYKKIAEKMSFWAGALNYQLLEKGMTQQQIDAAEEELSASI